MTSFRGSDVIPESDGAKMFVIVQVFLTELAVCFSSLKFSDDLYKILQDVF